MQKFNNHILLKCKFHHMITKLFLKLMSLHLRKCSSLTFWSLIYIFFLSDSDLWCYCLPSACFAIMSLFISFKILLLLIPYDLFLRSYDDRVWFVSYIVIFIFIFILASINPLRSLFSSYDNSLVRLLHRQLFLNKHYYFFCWITNLWS